MTPSQPSPTNLSDELKEKIRNTMADALALSKYDITDEAIAAITAAYAVAIGGCAPEKMLTDKPDNVYDEAYFYNKAIDTLTANLQKASLLPTNGSDEGSAR